jgi:hypothetical protein
MAAASTSTSKARLVFIGPIDGGFGFQVGQLSRYSAAGHSMQCAAAQYGCQRLEKAFTAKDAKDAKDAKEDKVQALFIKITCSSRGRI